MAKRQPSVKTLVDRQLGRNIVHPVLPSGDGFIIPNHSGDHSEGRVDSEPTNDTDLVNKKYVDDIAITPPPADIDKIENADKDTGVYTEVTPGSDTVVIKTAGTDKVKVFPDGTTRFLETGSAASGDDSVFISQSSDDAHESTGIVVLDASTINTSNRPDSGYRFQIAIPNGATIIKAFIEYEQSSDRLGDSNYTITAEAIDDSPTFTASIGNITTRTKTTNSVAWVLGDVLTNDRVQSDDISSVISEVVNRSGWVSGNSLSILLHTDSGVRKDIRTYDNAPGTAARLFVEYTTSAGTSHLDVLHDGVDAKYNTNLGGHKFNADVYANGNLLAEKEYVDEVNLLAKTTQTTGLLSGGLISSPTATTLDWTAGEGQVVDYSNPANPDVTRISWNEVLAYDPVNLGTNGQYFVAYNASGDIVEIDIVDFGAESIREFILIGVYTAFAGNVVRISTSSVNIGYDGFSSFKDFIRGVIGPANIDGNVISANGGNLSLDNSGGEFFIISSNFRDDPTIPDITPVTAGNAISYSRVLRQAPPSTIITQDGAGVVNVIDPTKYDDGSGTLASVVNKYSVQVVYITPDGGYVVAYGQELFNTESDAHEAVLNSSLLYEEYPLLQRLVRRAFIIVQGTETDLSNAIFVADGKFRVGGVGVGAGAVSSSVYFSASGATGTTSGTTALKIPFNSGQVIDPNTGFSDADDWYVIPEDGDYLISGGSEFIENGLNGRWEMNIRKNVTTSIMKGQVSPANNEDSMIAMPSKIVSLVAGDTIHLEGREAGTATGFRFGACHFSISKL